MSVPRRCATCPKGRPPPPDPQGGAGPNPRHPALRRGEAEGARRPTRRALTKGRHPHPYTSDPAPYPRPLRFIGRGSNSGPSLTPTTGRKV